MNTIFTVGQEIKGTYNGKERTGTVVEVLDGRIRVQVGEKEFRMFTVSKLTLS